VFIAYFLCTAASAPLVFRFLETLSSDKRLAIGMTSLIVCLPWALGAVYIFGYLTVVVLCALVMVIQVIVRWVKENRK
jgi:hypothetical protein